MSKYILFWPSELLMRIDRSRDLARITVFYLFNRRNKIYVSTLSAIIHYNIFIYTQYLQRE